MLGRLRLIIITTALALVAVACNRGQEGKNPGTPQSPSAVPPTQVSTSTVDSKSMRYGYQQNLGQVISDDQSDDGYNCFIGATHEEKHLNQIIYRLKSSFDPNYRIHTTEAYGYHITYARHLKVSDLSERYKKLRGVTEKERAERCQGRVIDSAFAGDEFNYRFRYHLDPNEPDPPTFAVTLDNTPENLIQIREKYAPLFVSVRQAHHAGETTFGESPTQELHLSPEIMQSPLEIIIAYLQKLEQTGDDPKNRNFLPIVHASPAPKF